MRAAVLVVFVSACAEPSAPPAAPADAAPPAAPPEEDPVDVVEADLAEFDRTVAEMQSKFDAIVAQPDDKAWVVKKLGHMVAVDQYMRKQFSRKAEYSDEQQAASIEAFSERAKAIDSRNTEDLELLMEKFGWFTISEFGEGASNAAWLLAQHADHDRPFQRRVLALMEPLVGKGEVNAQNYAYLYDRVAVAEDRPQRFATQGRCQGAGNWEPNELEEPDGVDDRRKQIGLPTLAEYQGMMNGFCK